MSALAATISEASAPPQGSEFSIREDAMDVHVRLAVMRMVEWCERQPQGAAFLARGLVIDATGDISRQIAGYFPAHIDTAPVIDDIAFVVGQNAKTTNQRFQELELAYIGDGKMPQVADANMQSLVKWYSAENAVGSDAQGNHKHLKPGWSGGAGGDGASLIKHLNLATKKGFLLQVRALDISDAKTQTLLANMDIVQAFGGTPAAVAEAAGSMAAGGAEGKQLQALIDQVVEVKQLRAALTNAGDTPAAAPIAAALAVKTEALAVTVQKLNVPAIVKTDVARSIEIVKTELTARQIESVVIALSRALPASIMMRPANSNVPATAKTGGGTAAPATITPPQISRAVEAIQQIARTQNMPVREVITLVLSGNASPALAAPVRTLATMMAKPDFMPTLDRSVPAIVAASVRASLTTPALQSFAQTPVSLGSVAQNLQVLADKIPAPAAKAMIAEAVARIDAAAQMAPVLRAPVMEAVAGNLQALSYTSMARDIPAPAMAVATAQVQTLAVQARQPSITPAPAPAPAMAPSAETPVKPVITPVSPSPVSVAAASVTPAASATPVSAAPVSPSPVSVTTTSVAPAPVQAPTPVPPQAPLAVVAQAVQVTPPTSVPPPPPPAIHPQLQTPVQPQAQAQQHTSPQGAAAPQSPAPVQPSPQPAAAEPKAHNYSPDAQPQQRGPAAAPQDSGAQPQARGNEWTPAKPANADPLAASVKVENPAAKKPGEAENKDDGPGCKGKKCKTCFDRACQTNVLEALNPEISTDVLKQRMEERAAKHKLTLG